MYDPHGEHPWVFRRDDVDLLEDQLEDLYRRYEGPESGPLTMEQEVLKEQLSTEESSDVELSMTLGEQLFDSVSRSDKTPPSVSRPAVVDRDSLPLLLSQQRDPLYVEARSWALEVFAYAQDQYADEELRCRELFRVYVNINLIPIKLATALQEEMLDDGFAQEVALKEYELTRTYLARVVSDLEYLVLNGFAAQKLHRMMLDGTRFIGLVQAREEQLRRRKNGSL